MGYLIWGLTATAAGGAAGAAAGGFASFKLAVIGAAIALASLILAAGWRVWRADSERDLPKDR